MTGKCISGDELQQLLHSSYPEWNQKMLTPGFSYDLNKLKNVDGFPSAAQKILAKMPDDPETIQDKKEMNDWYSQAKGMEAEEKVYKMLKNTFYKDTCMILPGFRGETMRKLSEAVIPQTEGDTFLSKEAEQFFTVNCVSEIDLFFIHKVKIILVLINKIDYLSRIQRASFTMRLKVAMPKMFSKQENCFQNQDTRKQKNSWKKEKICLRMFLLLWQIN